MSDAWDVYLRNQQNPQQPQKRSMGIPLLDMLLGRSGQGGAGPGQVPKPNWQGMYTPGVDMAAAGPPTPINYSAIRNMLNSGVMQTGQVPPTPQPAAPPPAPPPAPKDDNPFAAILSSIFGF